jgi:hypothetical protein
VIEQTAALRAAPAGQVGEIEAVGGTAASRKEA